MITDDKKITTPEYWDSVYAGGRNNEKQDASNNVRPKDAFDRFQWVADLAEGPIVLGVGSGHAHIEKRIKATHPDWCVCASDQSEAAKRAAKYLPYFIRNAYDLPEADKSADTIIAAQCLEYMDDIERFLKEAQRIAKKLIVTAPKGEMQKWSQLYIFDENNLRSILEKYGEIEVEDIRENIMLYKIKFHEL